MTEDFYFHVFLQLKKCIHLYIYLLPISDYERGAQCTYKYCFMFVQMQKMGAWVPGCLGAWVPGCLGAWVPGCLGAWVPGCLGAWVPGCLGAWVPGCLGAWVPGCLGAWVPGCLGAWVPGCLGAWVPGCLGAWVPGCRSADKKIFGVNLQNTAASARTTLKTRSPRMPHIFDLV